MSLTSMSAALVVAFLMLLMFAKPFLSSFTPAFPFSLLNLSSHMVSVYSQCSSVPHVCGWIAHLNN